MSPLQLTGLPLGPWCLGELTPVPDLLPSLPISPPAWTHLCSILAPALTLVQASLGLWTG